ncbi:MAG: class I SAM-dependent RNA methyltransferase [Oligoflexales bacterium]
MSTYFATCPQSLVPILEKELKELGAKEVRPQYMAVRFEADDSTSYRIHLQCSTASQILKLLRDCPASKPRILFDKARRISWETYLSSKTTYRIDGIAGDRGEGCMTSNEISKEVRHALTEHFEHIGEAPPRVDIKNPDIVIHAMVREKRAKISAATSGRALHKRGYRTSGHPAPLQETVAAALLRYLGYTGQEVLLDPMSGSGTIAIEAAMIALGKSVQIHRSQGSFGLEHMRDFDRNLWRQTADDLRKNAKQEVSAAIYAYDIEAKYTQMAKENALRARVERNINFATQSFLDSKKPAETGILICNLPYGKRIGDELETFYKQVGDHLKTEYTGWKAGLLIPKGAPSIGLKKSKVFKLDNGGIETEFQIFDLYSGSRKNH